MMAACVGRSGITPGRGAEPGIALSTHAVVEAAVAPRGGDPAVAENPLNVRDGSRRSRLVAVPVKGPLSRADLLPRARIIYLVG